MACTFFFFSIIDICVTHHIKSNLWQHRQQREYTTKGAKSLLVCSYRALHLLISLQCLFTDTHKWYQLGPRKRKWEFNKKNRNGTKKREEYLLGAAGPLFALLTGLVFNVATSSISKHKCHRHVFFCHHWKASARFVLDKRRLQFVLGLKAIQQISLHCEIQCKDYKTSLSDGLICGDNTLSADV